MKLSSNNITDLNSIAKELLANFEHKVIAFVGDMGVGKTTLIKEMIKILSDEDTGNSPSFSLVNEYLSKQGNPLYHFDFYRIQSPEEALDMGIEDYFYSGNFCFIEWPQKIENLLPDNLHILEISLQEEKRILNLKR